MIHKCLAGEKGQPPCPVGVCHRVELNCFGIHLLDYTSGTPLNGTSVVSPFPEAQKIVPSGPQAQGSVYPTVTWQVVPK